MVKGWPQHKYPGCDPVVVVMPPTNTVQNTGYQP